MSDANQTTKEIIDRVSKGVEGIEPTVVDALKEVFSSEPVGDLKKSEITELAKELVDLQTDTNKKKDEEQD